MKNIKRICTSIILGVYLCSNLLVAQAETSERNNYMIKVIAHKSNLKKVRNGNKYITSIDKIIDGYSDNKKALTTLSERVKKATVQLENQNSKQATEVKKIIRYLDAKIMFAMYELDNKVLTIDEMLQNSNVSISEKKEVEDKLVALQLNVLEKGTSSLQSIIDDFEKYSNSQETGNLKMNLDIDHESLGTVKSYLNFSDYTVTSSNFDSQIKGKIEALIDASVQGQDAIKLELEGLVDFISKDGNMYLLLEKFKILQKENVKEFEEFITMVEQIAKENKYIKYSDEETKKGLEILQQLTPSKILADGKNILSKPMFQPYKKEGNKYYLIPTKYGCDSMKKFTNKFDPFNGSSCSQSQYENILKDLASTGKIYIELGKVTKLGFEGIKSNEVEKFDSYITFTDTSINELFLEIQPNQVKNPGEHVAFHYIKNKKITGTSYVNRGKIDIDFDSTLDKNNRFTSINYNGKIKGTRNNLETSLHLEKNKISGIFDYQADKYSYDYETGKGGYEPSSHVKGNLSGITQSDNTLGSINITYTGTDLKTNTQYLDGSFLYDYPKFSFVNNYDGVYMNSDLELSGTWNEYSKNFSAFDFLFNLGQGDTPILESNFQLKNSILSGGMNINMQGKEYFTLTTTGEYKKNYLVLNNKFKVVNPMLYSTLETYLDGNFNLGVDTRNNANNANIKLDITSGNKQFFNFEMINQSKIQYKKVNIITPTNIIESEKINK